MVGSYADSLLNFSFTEDPSDDNGEGYLYDDSKLEPVATEQEVAAYKESSAREEEERQEYRRRRIGETSVSTWYALLLQLYIYFPPARISFIFVLCTRKTSYRVFSRMTCLVLLQGNLLFECKISREGHRTVVVLDRCKCSFCSLQAINKPEVGRTK